MDSLHASYQPAPTAPTSGECSCRRPHGDAVNALAVALSHQRVAMLVAVRSAACKAFKLKQLQLCAASVRSTPQIAAAASHSFLKSITLLVLTQGVLHFLTAVKMLHLVSKVHVRCTF